VAGHIPRIALAIDYARPPLPQLQAVADLERRGLLDEVWVPEVYGADAPTLLGYLAARTERVALAAGVLSVYSRAPALIAQTALGLDAVSGGRAVLGIGTSGPQVVEGLHGVPFARPLAHLRETIEVCRAAWRRERVVSDGPRPVPLPPDLGTGLGRPLRLIGAPERERVPIVVAALRPGGAALAAELAEGWYPLMVVPETIDAVWGEALARGKAMRDPALGPLRVIAGAACAVGEDDEVAPAREAARRELALYVGGMGPPERNFYAEAIARMGFAPAVGPVRDRFLAGDREGAAAAVPDELLDAVALIGSPARVAARLRALGAAGVDTVVVRPLGQPATTCLERLGTTTGRTA
jgi:F420-dependent oxidoreductase-like protein